MAVFYGREKSKIGTNTGTIINWSRQLGSNDPDDSGAREALPAGYLRCDGSIYSAEVFPQLAEILGTGSNSRYRKPDIALLDNQFQLPDFGSKKIRASSGSNLGEYIDLYIEDDGGDTITKSGVGLQVNSNIGTTYEILYQGSFFLPSQQIQVTGEPGFTRSSGNYTENSDVLSNAFLPHGHFHDGTRTRIASSVDEYASFGRNSYTRKSTLCVLEWAENTRQDLCHLAALRIRLSDEDRVETNSLGCTKTYYGGCFTGCEFNASFECLMPDTFNCAYPTWSGQSTVCGGSSGNLESVTCGSIEYRGTVASVCSGGIQCLGGGFTAEPLYGNTPVPANYFDENLPFDSFKDADNDGFCAINNTTNQTRTFGDNGEHRHFIQFSAEPQTYVVNTRPSFIPAADLVSTIRVTVNEENKADQFVQPYIVQEFLIKY